MPINIQHDEVQRLMAAGAQLIDVLPRGEYDAEHIAGAINLPLKELDQQSAAILDRDRPVIVYCWDLL
ncbi:MAG: rhodanese-like domain-containing protein [Chloroflexota bacterium]|nr:rhodanese-like domain-containing protein [Chloroflexota bacterium]